MTQSDMLAWLIEYLLDEAPEYRRQAARFGADQSVRFRLFRSLVNVRPPKPASAEFLRIQDEYLSRLIAQRGVTDGGALRPARDGLCLWRGDITALRCDAIVNAANSALLGCFLPCHGCIDNAIHTYAGIQLRLACAELMRRQGHEEPTGQAKLTPAFNLPCKFVLHTVGPIVSGGEPTARDRELLSSCYRSCLALAEQGGAQSIAFCCVSTGVFHFPNAEAAALAVRTVREYKQQTKSGIKVIFNVFKAEDERLYGELLGAAQQA